jgi:hypothetical protein
MSERIPMTQRLLDALAKTKRPMTALELRAYTGLPARSVQNALMHLLDDGRVEREGDDRSRTRAAVYTLPLITPPRVAAGNPLGLRNGVLREEPAIAPTWPAPRGVAPFHGWPLIAAPFHPEAAQC